MTHRFDRRFGVELAGCGHASPCGAGGGFFRGGDRRAASIFGDGRSRTRRMVAAADDQR